MSPSNEHEKTILNNLDHWIEMTKPLNQVLGIEMKHLKYGKEELNFDLRDVRSYIEGLHAALRYGKLLPAQNPTPIALRPQLVGDR